MSAPHLDRLKKAISEARTKDLPAHRKRVNALSWSAGGEFVASGSQDKSARIWVIDAGKGHKDVELHGHTEGVEQLCWNPLSINEIATTSSDKSLRLWDRKSGKMTKMVVTTGRNLSLGWSPDGEYLVVGNRDDVVTVYDRRTMQVVKSKKFSPVEVNDFAFTPTSDALLLSTQKGEVEVHSFPDLELVQKFRTNGDNCCALHLDKRGKLLATGGTDAIISLFSLPEMMCVATFFRPEYPIRALSFNHTSDLLASSSEEKSVEIYNIYNGKDVEGKGEGYGGEIVHKLPTVGHTNALAWHPKRDLLAFAPAEEADDRAPVRLFSIHR
uniref:THO complex subunit 3 n=1 Tax=Palpitomonas bilix TaxID=652834 RepID=A0A7S3DJ33_9EUKA|mmetsp:Transcript_39205/g.100454  ORF Transcript_39205/g.100454 Transcript_39205/m.100454 type:complete len:327 (+) Transcript_39205:298-1278(+)|eukprot:CAMPEP_0113880158 /NCGR_PEP_ID=MMETSP0780_2-20120614/7631_1 /TAXON_ID=652834 /ORGANISM="Palpitomonas bilix" /LENGTH=326 /DNA_ID=CAMNT_0000866805 /DNA_START=178 /DNA_END=1158 /DNA_ORIENTATION=+ /assembly_acc=CAM_ASM_000599